MVYDIKIHWNRLTFQTHLFVYINSVAQWWDRSTHSCRLRNVTMVLTIKYSWADPWFVSSLLRSNSPVPQNTLRYRGYFIRRLPYMDTEAWRTRICCCGFHLAVIRMREEDSMQHGCALNELLLLWINREIGVCSRGIEPSIAMCVDSLHGGEFVWRYSQLFVTITCLCREILSIAVITGAELWRSLKRLSNVLGGVGIDCGASHGLVLLCASIISFRVRNVLCTLRGLTRIKKRKTSLSRRISSTYGFKNYRRVYT